MDCITKKHRNSKKTAKIENYIIANNNNCLKAMEETAKTKGYKVIKMQIFGEIKDTVKKILENISEEEKHVFNFRRRANS